MGEVPASDANDRAAAGAVRGQRRDRRRTTPGPPACAAPSQRHQRLDPGDARQLAAPAARRTGDPHHVTSTTPDAASLAQRYAHQLNRDQEQDSQRARNQPRPGTCAARPGHRRCAERLLRGRLAWPWPAGPRWPRPSPPTCVAAPHELCGSGRHPGLAHRPGVALLRRRPTTSIPGPCTAWRAPGGAALHPNLAPAAGLIGARFRKGRFAAAYSGFEGHLALGGRRHVDDESGAAAGRLAARAGNRRGGHRGHRHRLLRARHRAGRAGPGFDTTVISPLTAAVHPENNPTTVLRGAAGRRGDGAVPGLRPDPARMARSDPARKPAARRHGCSPTHRTAGHLRAATSCR